MALKHARPPMEASPQLKLTRSVAIVNCELWRKWHSACPVCGLLDHTNHYMSSIYFGAQEHALVMLVTLKLCSFRSQMYFGGTGCKSSYFRRVHGTPGTNKCSFANPCGISRLGSQCSSTFNARIKALKNKNTWWFHMCLETQLWSGSVPICASFTGVCSWADLKPPSLCREAKLFISD